MKENVKNILLIQPKVPPYRIEIFKALAKELGSITILHFDTEKRFVGYPEIHEILGDKIEIKTFKYIKGLRKLMKQFDVVITLFDFHWINAFMTPFFKNSYKTIVWGHGLGKNNLINKLRKIGFNKADAIITYNKSGKDKIVNLGVKADKIFIAHNTLKVANYQDTSLQSKKVFLYVGRLQERKKLDIFIQIFAEQKLHEQGYTFHILGDGKKEKERLLDIVKSNNVVPYVHFFRGTSNDDELAHFFRDALVYISPGAVGLGVLHSFAYGVPVLTIADVGHGPEVSNVTNGKTGYLFENQHSFEDFFKQKDLEEKLRIMGKNGFEHFSNNRTVDRMVTGFKNAINHTN